MDKGCREDGKALQEKRAGWGKDAVYRADSHMMIFSHEYHICVGKHMSDTCIQSCATMRMQKSLSECIYHQRETATIHTCSKRRHM